jgi:RsiW-degrading membrane proteinase PrsW (M82 family)
MFLIIASLIPVLLLINYGVRKTNADWGSSSLWIGLAVGAGMGVVAYFAEELIIWLLHVDPRARPTLGGAFTQGFIVAGIPEEVVRYAGLLLVIARYLEGRRLQDVLLLAVGIGMGFAGLENLLYLTRYAQVWEFLALMRSVSAIPAHGILALIMGALLIATVLSDEHRWLGLLMALVVPILLHGLYDSLLFAAVGNAAVRVWSLPATVIVMTTSGLVAVGLCNMVLPEAAEMDAQIDRKAVRVMPRRRSKWLVRFARVYLVALVLAAKASGFDPTICWNLAFVGVLPLILSFDLIFTRSPAPSATQFAQPPLEA